ncbi:low molecular weight protein-tyrosine-phosphatase [Nocardioides speluncae]|uniref:low molecular weight protein-tyrosine-phosphatase n=1 Tax=Nocardioides speluncae TaxID=2670337 RepID=UPI001F0BDB10|nr:low molecular weight protein-tyrosine-phosphatase [Nocardioides speluncae]
MPAVPPQRPADGSDPRPYRIAMVCLGNICRSPMAQVVVESRLAEAGLAELVSVDSSGTGGWHVGDPMDHRAAATLSSYGYDGTRHRARQFTRGWDASYDLVLAMDEGNLADLRALTGGAGEAGRLRLFRDFDPDDPGAAVPDPYYGGGDGFEEVLRMVDRSADTLVAALTRELLPAGRADR